MPLSAFVLPTVVVIFPFRDREAHYVKHVSHLEAQGMPNANIKVMVVEQDDADPFNRAWLFNVGISEAFKYFPHAQCYVTHDIDLFATPQVDYTWCDRPTQPCSELTCHNNGVPYLKNAGGVVQARPSDWLKLNGYTNKAVGWGGEDDDLFHRLRLSGLLFGKSHIRRPPGQRKVQVPSRPRPHQTARRQTRVPNNTEKLSRMAKGSNEWTTDGLNTLTYNVTSRHYNKYKTLWIK